MILMKSFVGFLQIDFSLVIEQSADIMHIFSTKTQIASAIN